MMKIKMKYFGLITNDLGSEAELPEGSSVSDLLNLIVKQDPNYKEILTRATILVNNSKADIDTVLKHNDEVMVLAVLGGG